MLMIFGIAAALVVAVITIFGLSSIIDITEGSEIGDLVFSFTVAAGLFSLIFLVFTMAVYVTDPDAPATDLERFIEQEAYDSS